jgi:hypothetical protein
MMMFKQQFFFYNSHYFNRMKNKNPEMFTLLDRAAEPFH